MESNERLRKITEFVQERRAATQEKLGPDFNAFDDEYRWLHSLRVTQYGKQIAEAEGAEIEVVMAACLLHDIAKFDDQDYGLEHGRIGARIARPFLETLDYSPDQRENICFSIAAHVDDQTDFEHPVTLESKIVSDADQIDRFGAYRLLLQFREQTEVYGDLVEKAKKRLVTLRSIRDRNRVDTPTGSKLFARQLELQIHFLEHLVDDSERTIFPNL